MKNAIDSFEDALLWVASKIRQAVQEIVYTIELIRKHTKRGG